MISPFSGSVIRANVSDASQSNQASQPAAPTGNQFIAFKGQGVSIGTGGSTSTSSVSQSRQQQAVIGQRPDIIIEGADQYHELKEEDPSADEIEKQQKIMNLIKQSQQNNKV